MTCAEFTSKTPGVKKCNDKRCKCCNVLLIGNSYTFKHTQTKFTVKTSFTCRSFNLIYVIICPGCGEEYIGETGGTKTRLKDRVTVYRQHISNPEYEMIKVEEHLRECGAGNFKIFPFLQIRSDDIDLRRKYEKDFIRKFKVTLNRLT